MAQTRRDWLTQPGGLAERLTAMRNAAGMTGDQLAERLGWKSRSKVPKIENGRQMPTVDDLKGWAEATGHAGQTDELLKMRADAIAVHVQWKKQLKEDGGHVAVQKSFDELVRGADLIRSIQTTLVPGLLQTPDYARYRALETVRRHGADPDKVNDVVAARMRRGEVLYDTSKQFEFIVLEAALRHLLCPPEVMVQQLDRLQSVIGMPNMRFGVIPFSKQISVAPVVGFIMADDVAVVETYSAADQLRGDEALEYAKVMEDTWPDAVEGEDARRSIADAAQALRSS